MLHIRGVVQPGLQNIAGMLESLSDSSRKIQHVAKYIFVKARQEVHLGFTRFKTFTNNLLSITQDRVTAFYSKYILHKPLLVPVSLQRILDMDDIEKLLSVLEAQIYEEKELESGVVYSLIQQRKGVVIALLENHHFSQNIRAKVLSFAAASNDVMLIRAVLFHGNMPPENVQDAFFHAISRGHHHALNILLDLYQVEKAVYTAALVYAPPEFKQAIEQLLQAKA